MNSRLFCSIAALLLSAPPAYAELQLPQPSPAATVKQTVGLTDITVEYSSPGVKGRKIWGEVVPMDKPWRAGANAATKVTFSKDVTFGGKKVAAGSYALVAFPTAKGWTVSLNKGQKLFQGNNYNPKEDVVKVNATTAAIADRERLAYVFSGTTDTDTSLDLEWEKLRVSVPVKTDTAAQVQASIKETLEEVWYPHAAVARYVADTQKDYAAALKHAEKSVAIQSTWYNNWVKAEILAKSGNYAEARKAAQTSWDLGNKAPDFFFKDAVAKALVDWKDKT